MDENTMQIAAGILGNSVSGAMTAEEMEEKAENLLKEKYGESFTVTRIYQQKLFETYYSAQCVADAAPEWRFMAYIDTEGDGMSDNYAERSVCTKIAEQMMADMDGMPGTYHVYVRGLGPQPTTAKPSIGISEYLALDPENTFEVYFYLVPEEQNAGLIYEALSAGLKELQMMKGLLHVCILETDTLKDVLNYFDKYDNIYFVYRSIEQRVRDNEMEFENGSIKMDKKSFEELMKEVL